MNARISLETLARLDHSHMRDLHLHTNYTDGTASIYEMAEQAQNRGVTEILFSEHVRHTSTYFPEFAAQVRATDFEGVKIFVGVEAKVLNPDGQLDLSAETAAMCDAIIGSVHSPPGDGTTAASWSKMNPQDALALEFKLAAAIVTSSPAHVLGHPLGMCITKFQLQPLEELSELARLCAVHGKAFELNPRYCANVEAWLQIVTEANCPVSIGSDAHKVQDVGRAWDVFVARQGEQG